MRKISEKEFSDFIKILKARLRYNLKAIILFFVCVALIVAAIIITDMRKNPADDDGKPSYNETVETDYYKYTLNDSKDGYKLSLQPKFRDALEKNTQYVLRNEILWNPETPLPNPGSSCDGIPVVNMSGVFEKCDTVLRLDLSKWETDNVTNVDSMFSGCSALSILDISGFNTANITRCENVFLNCFNMKSVLVNKDGDKTFVQTAIDNSKNFSKVCDITVLSSIRWVALGDSITEGNYSLENGTYSKSSNMGWVVNVARLTGMKLDNKGVSGTGYVDTKSKYDITNGRTIVSDIDFANYDLVTIAYGMNDFRNGARLGSFDDINAENTVYSNMRYIVEKISKDNPDCKIIMITPMNCLGYGSYDTDWALGYEAYPGRASLVDIYNACREVCEYYGITMIDMTYNSFINRNNIQNYLLDKLHPTPEGYKILGEELAHKIKFSF